MRASLFRLLPSAGALALFLSIGSGARAEEPVTTVLPIAPSSLEYTLLQNPAPQSVMVNGRPYHRPTRHEDFVAYRRELIGPRVFISAAIRAGIEQLRPVPTGWGQDFPGYAQRYGSAYGEFGIDSTVRFGLAALSHEDVRYLVCHKCSVGEKFANAALSQVTARHGEDGHRVFSPTPIIAGFSGPLIAYAAWYPPGYTEGDAAKHAFLGFGFHIVGNIVREFLDRKP